MKTKFNFKKILRIALRVILVSAVVVLFFLSPLAKFLLEKYDVKLIGRELTLDRAYVNPFTGYIHINNLKIFEEKGDSLFLSAEGASARFSLHKLLWQTVEITDRKSVV